MNKITSKGRETMQRVYSCIVDYTLENLYPPSIPEIKELTGIKSTSTIQTNLIRLEIEEKVKLANGNRCISLCGYKLIKA